MSKFLFSAVVLFIIQLSQAQTVTGIDAAVTEEKPALTYFFSAIPLPEDRFARKENPISEPAKTLSAPVNDEPCNAIVLTVNNFCSYRIYTNSEATASPAVPEPGCANYLGADVWFRIIVPAEGSFTIDTQPAGMTDGGMAIYQGNTCSSLTLIACNDNSSSNGAMPLVKANNLAPGSTVWIRVWGRSNISNGTFGICVNIPIALPPCSGNMAAGNTCADATAVCNFNGYCGNTSESYTEDTWPELSNAFRDCIGGGATIENNSFLSFVAIAEEARFNVWVTSSQDDNGIQMMFYEGDCGTGPVICHGGYNNILNGPTLISATALIPGSTYYLMIDGVGRDVCEYILDPVSGVDLLDINPRPANICSGGSINLTATGGNGVYAWSPATGLSNTTGTTVAAAPAMTTTYSVTSAGVGLCPAAITKQITVLVIPPPVTSTSASICPSELPYTWNGRSITSAGFFADTLTNSFGCDSVLNLVLTINPNTSSITNIGACTAQLPYQWNGNSYTTGGTYNASFSNAAGCDSTATLTLTIGAYSRTTTNLGICPSQVPYQWNNHTITAAGTYADTMRGASGCDSIATLVLTIHSNSSGTSNDTICSSQLPFRWNGNNYNSAGSYQVTLVNAAGCDSLATLVLTVKNSSSASTNARICKTALPYVWNGINYNASGTYSISLLNTMGCDSVETLILQVNDSTSSVTNQSVCPYELPFVWNGNRYREAGTYQVHLLNTGGCDSLAILNLAVKPGPAVSLGKDTSFCPGDSITLYPGTFDHYLWQDASTAPSFKVLQTGNYSVKVSNDNECPGTAKVAIIYLPICSDISFPNAITPNGDGNNDHFGAMGDLFMVSSYSLWIYNRNGELVFSTNNPYKRWNGIANNKAVGNNSFTWYSAYTFKGKVKKMQKGSLVVLR